MPPIPGTRNLSAYLSEAEERALAEAIDALPWNTEWKRRTATTSPSARRSRR